MELSVRERLRLASILPERGDFVTLKIVRRLREDLSFSEDEIAVLQFKQEEDRLIWQAEADLPREFSFGPKATEIMVAALKRVEEAGDLDGSLAELFEKFVDTSTYDLGGEA